MVSIITKSIINQTQPIYLKVLICELSAKYVSSFIRIYFIFPFQQSYLHQLPMFGAPLALAPTIPSSPDSIKLIEAIRDQTDGVPPHLVFVIDIVSVRFGGYFTPEIKAELQKFAYLQLLTLNDCGIVSLENFPHLPGLIRLDLVFNQIAGETLKCIRGSRHLQTLMLGANKIQKFQHLEQISNLKQLLQLDLINNPVSKLPGYREKMFSIFPTISILDTLDRSGKDAYTSSSMALTVSRVPDTLFDRSPVVPVFAPPAPVVAPTTVARTSSVSRAPVVRTSSHTSVKSKTTNKKPIIASKKAKSGKLGKTAIVSKSRSGSSRAGLTFPVGRIRRRLKENLSGVRISKGTSVYLAAVLQYLTIQLLEGAGNLAKEDKKRRITPSQLKRCLKNDEQFHKLLSGVTFAMGE